MMRRTRDTVFWPAMSHEIPQVAENCETYTNHGIRETLRCMKKGKPREAKIGVYLFEIKGRNYLVTVDYYSNCLKVDYLSTTMTKQVITKLKGHFATYGIPLQMVTDSAPQFLS